MHCHRRYCWEKEVGCGYKGGCAKSVFYSIKRQIGSDIQDMFSNYNDMIWMQHEVLYRILRTNNYLLKIRQHMDDICNFCKQKKNHNASFS